MTRDQTVAEMTAEIKTDFRELGTKMLLGIYGTMDHPNCRCTFVPQVDIIDVDGRDVADRLALPEEAG